MQYTHEINAFDPLCQRVMPFARANFIHSAAFPGSFARNSSKES